jgi:hypothetical protein
LVAVGNDFAHTLLTQTGGLNVCAFNISVQTTIKNKVKGKGLGMAMILA